jgi:nanoRNase/pAp phosphatase (c-di-AMP/oligoRNAs hydrolase)
MQTKSFRELLAVLDKNRPLIIQAHDYPDYDALASGYALVHLLSCFGYGSSLCYSGEMQGFSQEGAVSTLKIPAMPASSLKIDADSQIVLVDGSAGNKNVTNLAGKLTGIIDHHPPPPCVPPCPFIDIRPETGACSTIIHQYYLETLTGLPREVATALLAGIMMDTASMTRGVSPADLAAFCGLFFTGDWEAAAYVLRNSFSIDDIPFLRHTLDNYCCQGAVCFVEIPAEARPELLGLAADHFLRMREIHFVVAFSAGGGGCRLSLRSEDPRLPAGLLIRRALEGIGAGGGHQHMSGGHIPPQNYHGAEELRKRFLTHIENAYKEHP